MLNEQTALNFNFRSWIQSHEINDHHIKLITDYGEANISFIK